MFGRIHLRRIRTQKARRMAGRRRWLELQPQRRASHEERSRRSRVVVLHDLWISKLGIVASVARLIKDFGKAERRQNAEAQRIVERVLSFLSLRRSRVDLLRGDHGRIDFPHRLRVDKKEGRVLRREVRLLEVRTLPNREIVGKPL